MSAAEEHLNPDAERETMIVGYSQAINCIMSTGDFSWPSDPEQQRAFKSQGRVKDLGEFLAISGRLGFETQKPILDLGLAALVYKSGYKRKPDLFRDEHPFADAAITAFELIAKGMPSANEGKPVGQ